MTTSNRRSPHAQQEAMYRLWPDFDGLKAPNGLLCWYGPLRPKAQKYFVEIYWHPKLLDRPHVIIAEPAIKPIAENEYENIPHLIFKSTDPQRSALCLFDPDGNEWTPCDLIAETTVCWTAEWLIYYELWHLTGEWLAPSVGYESVGHIMKAVEAETLEKAAEYVHG